MRVRFLAEAKDEADIAQLRYELMRRGLGQAFATALDNAIEAILRNPRTWPRAATRDSTREVRHYTITPYSYQVVYEIQGEELIVVAIAHLHQSPGYWQDRRD